MGLGTVVSNCIATQTRCLEHQLPEDQPSPYGLICRECHARLREDPPRGSCRGVWESQPVLSDGEPCAVFALVWDNFQIRSLHPPKEEFSPAELESPLSLWERARVRDSDAS